MPFKDEVQFEVADLLYHHAESCLLRTLIPFFMKLWSQSMDGGIGLVLFEDCGSMQPSTHLHLVTFLGIA